MKPDWLVVLFRHYKYAQKLRWTIGTLQTIKKWKTNYKKQLEVKNKAGNVYTKLFVNAPI